MYDEDMIDHSPTKKPFYLEAYDWVIDFIRRKRRPIAVAVLILAGGVIQKLWPDNPIVEPILQFVRAIILLLGVV